MADALRALTAEIEQLKRENEIIRAACGGRRPWCKVGTVADVESVKQRYPTEEYAWGVKYHQGSIMEVQLNSWNQGQRLSTVHPYPQGDSSSALTMGRSYWTKGLAGAADASQWYHHYAHDAGATPGVYTGNGAGGASAELFVQLR